MNSFMEQEIGVKTLYARMFFRKRYWYTIKHLRKYTERNVFIDNSLKQLYSLGFLKSDEDALFENDFERINELFEEMLQH